MKNSNKILSLILYGKNKDNNIHKINGLHKNSLWQELKLKFQMLQ